MSRRMLVAAALLGAAAAPAEAQTLAQRIARAGDGTVVMHYATRAGVCGDGREAVALGNALSVYPSMLSFGRWSGVRCAPGPARVRVTVDRGQVTAVRTSVGGSMPLTAGSSDLGTVSAAEAAAFLLEIVRRGEGRVARDAILPAAIADSATVWPALLEVARDASRPREARRQAVFWSAIIDEPQARAALRDLAQDAGADEDVRGEAIFALGQLGSSDEDERFLRELYRRLDSPKLREKVIAGLGAGHAPESQRWLLDLATRDAEPMELRKHALFWAVQGDEGAPIADVVRVYPRLGDRRLREHYAFVLSQRHEDEAVSALIDIARSDADLEVRKKAYFWLGQSDSPRARRFLMETITR